MAKKFTPCGYILRGNNIEIGQNYYFCQGTRANFCRKIRKSGCQNELVNLTFLFFITLVKKLQLNNFPDLQRVGVQDLTPFLANFLLILSPLLKDIHGNVNEVQLHHSFPVTYDF